MTTTQQQIITTAVDTGLESFWHTVAAQFPGVLTGDFPPFAQIALEKAARLAVEQWLSINRECEDGMGRDVPAALPEGWIAGPFGHAYMAELGTILAAPLNDDGTIDDPDDVAADIYLDWDDTEAREKVLTWWAAGCFTAEATAALDEWEKHRYDHLRDAFKATGLDVGAA